MQEHRQGTGAAGAADAYIADRRGRWADLTWSVAFLVVALAVRWPYLLRVPRLTDEGFQVLWGLGIAQGKHFPLTGVNAYDGPLFSYLVAGLFRVFGVGFAVPRAMVMVAGALTAVTVFWLGRLVIGRRAGLVAAALTATSPILVVLSGHHGWSSSLTPFFAVATALALHVGVRRHSSWALVAGGFLAGLTLQTHPTSSLALLGMFLWFMLEPDRSARLRRPAPWLALGLFLLAYAPVIIANARVDSPMIRDAFLRPYAFAPAAGLHAYLGRLGPMLAAMASAIGGGLAPAGFGLRVAKVLMTTGAIAGLVVAWRRGERMAALVFGTTVLLLPVLVVGFSYRYFIALLPLGYVAVGTVVAAAIRALSSPADRTIGVHQFARAATRVTVAGTVAFLVGFPLITVARHYRFAEEQGRTNEGYFRLAELLRAEGACGPRLFIEEHRPESAASADLPAAFAISGVNYVLTMEPCRHLMVPRANILERIEADAGSGYLVAPQASLPAYAERLDLAPVATVLIPEFDTEMVAVSLYHASPKRHR